MSATTATVETLKAEVRTLMVGNRQVTLSVAKQLDRVPLNELEVFGRIHLGKESNLVVGRHVESGALALSSFRSFKPFIGFIELTDGAEPLLDYPMVCSSLNNRLDNGFRLALDDVPFILADRNIRRCQISGHFPYSRDSCDNWDPGSFGETFRKELQRQREAYERKVSVNRAAAESPLIVLAGLR